MNPTLTEITKLQQQINKLRSELKPEDCLEVIYEKCKKWQLVFKHDENPEACELFIRMYISSTKKWISIDDDEIVFAKAYIKEFNINWSYDDDDDLEGFEESLREDQPNDHPAMTASTLLTAIKTAFDSLREIN